MKREILKSWKPISYLTPVNHDQILNGKWFRLFTCVCWVEKQICKKNVISWSTKSCWCMKWNLISKRFKSHWMWWLSGIYNIFRSMKSRCNNPNNKDYDNYWWRWIKVCRNSFEEFYEDMSPGYINWLTIDRIDPDWDYHKRNCRWLERTEQTKNTRKSWKLMFNNKEYSLKWLIKELHMWRHNILSNLDTYWITVIKYPYWNKWCYTGKAKIYKQ